MFLQAVHRILQLGENDFASVEFLIDGEKEMWITEKNICNLLDTDESTLNQCLNSIFECGEADRDSAVADFEINTLDGKNIKTKAYTVDVLVSAGYCIKSERAIKFRQWMTGVLGKYRMKGFVLDEEHLKG